jgi:hypothetical protein
MDALAIKSRTERENIYSMIHQLEQISDAFWHDYHRTR